MSEAPERIRAKPDDWHEPDHPWMHATCSDVFDFDVEYLRADIAEAEKAEAVREAVKAERDWCAQLAETYAEDALREAQEANTAAATAMNLDKARAAHVILAAIRGKG